jgi:hypothetical protein
VQSVVIMSSSRYQVGKGRFLDQSWVRSFELKASVLQAVELFFETVNNTHIHSIKALN